MAAVGNPKTWIPYVNIRDCSQGFCSVYCPQWCYIVLPPPPPPALDFPQDDNSSQSFSPLVIAIIGILASAFLLVSYYTFISKYCGNRGGSSDRENSLHHQNEEIEDNHNPSLHEPWHVQTNGLDEALIKSITVCKYKRGDGLVGVTDCSVCLSEFQEDEHVRLLPKCSHAFHLPCIDQWLKSHSNCPLCRSLIFTFSNSSTPQVMVPPVIQESESSSSSREIQNASEENGVGVGRRSGETVVVVEESPKPALRAFSDLGFLRGRHRMIEMIRDEADEEDEAIRRSVSMDHHSLQIGGVAVGSNEASTSKRSSQGESSKSSSRRRVTLHCVLSPITMKRSFSSGRFSFRRNGRGRQGIIPA
ncbi:hypothetical protein QN277_028479 [Acacia crassicarpa]|uniref:RING-type E3 ubiquitin transferase n=1 Tax=Acacia crassicarpa TaxID=499986 RepID=A0AAE1J5X9_9FABA|nr:hypothetical protein QN277_028479 [Acacia crassicarpa]